MIISDKQILTAIKNAGITVAVVGVILDLVKPCEALAVIRTQRKNKGRSSPVGIVVGMIGFALAGCVLGNGIKYRHNHTVLDFSHKKR